MRSSKSVVMFSVFDMSHNDFGVFVWEHPAYYNSIYRSVPFVRKWSKRAYLKDTIKPSLLKSQVRFNFVSSGLVASR